MTAAAIFFTGMVAGCMAGIMVMCLAIVAGRVQPAQEPTEPQADAKPSDWIDVPAATCPHGIEADQHCNQCTAGWRA